MHGHPIGGSIGKITPLCSMDTVKKLKSNYLNKIMQLNYITKYKKKQNAFTGK